MIGVVWPLGVVGLDVVHRALHVAVGCRLPTIVHLSGLDGCYLLCPLFRVCWLLFVVCCVFRFSSVVWCVVFGVRRWVLCSVCCLSFVFGSCCG